LPARACRGWHREFLARPHRQRTVEPGDLFVALKGERFNAHDFIADVVARGAAAVLVSREVELACPPSSRRIPASRWASLAPASAASSRCPRWP
jgi:UDP-N-acetylmuramyl pentapeptide synthase